MKPAPPHSDAAHAAISAELVRLSLDGRPDRTELADWQRFADTETRRKTTRRKGRR